MSKKYPGFILRTVKKGKIKFDGIYWEPATPTGRLDNLRFAFGVYVEGCYSHPVKRLDMLCLWGTEKVFKISEDASRNYNELEDCPELNEAWKEEKALLAPDGVFNQNWWRPQEGKG